jgi:hypothetical protein
MMTASLISLPPLVTADGRFVPDALLTVRQAAALCGCHMITVRRRVEAGLLPAAHKSDHDGSHRWQIPVRALAHAGLLPAAQVAEDGAVPDPQSAGTQGHLQHLVEENRRLARTVTSLQRDNLFLRSLLGATTGGAA